MAKTPKKPPPTDEDEAQSRRFLDTARSMEIAGELSPTEDGGAFERLVKKAVPSRMRRKNESPES
jgi:hypothetical protein